MKPWRKLIVSKLFTFAILVALPFCLFIYAVTWTLSLGIQHDTDPEAFKKTLESLGVLEVKHFVIPPINLPLPDGDGETIKGKISHYWPPLGGTNCGSFVNGVCVSRMASGEPWQEWVDVAVACPFEYPFGTKFVIQGKTWVCMDRGGGIKVILEWILGKLTQTVWLDMLTEHTDIPYGSVIDVQVYLSDEAVPTPITPPVDVNISTGGYFVIARQNLFQKAMFGYLRLMGLISDDLLAIEVGINPDDPTAPTGPTPEANCDDPETPCLFPIEGGLSSIVVGSAANGGLSCHTSGGPITIKGWDYWTPSKSEGSIIYATMNGYVDWAGHDGLGSSVIQISNGRYLLTYMHMKQMFVQTGQKITQGQPIGILGDVGYSDWPHLHYGVYEKGVGPVCDQMSFFQK